MSSLVTFTLRERAEHARLERAIEEREREEFAKSGMIARARAKVAHALGTDYACAIEPKAVSTKDCFFVIEDLHFCVDASANLTVTLGDQNVSITDLADLGIALDTFKEAP